MSQNMHNQFPWSSNACYEPPPLPRRYGKRRFSDLAKAVGAVLLILAGVSLMLWAASHV